MRSTRLLALGCVLSLFVACSDAPGPEGTAAPGQTEAPAKKESKKGDGNDDAKEAGKKASKGTGAPGSGGVGKAGPSERSKRSGGGDGAGPSGGSGEAALAYPAAGRYVFEQSGYEEFCQTTECDKEDLPPQQPIDISYKERDKDSAVLVSESRTSKKRVSRTTFEFTPEHALITEVYTKFNYQNFDFEDRYQPDPPIEALRFPLKVGMKWSGEWKDKTSGDYTIAVQAKERVSVAGNQIDTFRIQTETNFRGQFDGKSVTTIWYDPNKKSIVKSKGNIEVKSAFGRYRSEFATLLSSGPGY